MLSDKRILVVENEPLIALELATTIAEANGIVSALARSRREALPIAQSMDIDVAILDVNLSDGKCFPIASLLAERKIPFLFCTGDNIDTQQFAEWPGVPVIMKPYKEEMLMRGILQLLGKDVPACMA
jgi:DNA-binding response OmpR family regulator